MPGARIDAVQIISQRLLTLPEAAHYLGCTPWSVRELIWKGQLSYTRFGTRFQIAEIWTDWLIEKKSAEGRALNVVTFSVL